MDLLFCVALHHVRPVGGHGDDGDAEVDPQHVDDAEAAKGQTGDDVSTLHVGKTSSATKMTFWAHFHQPVDVKLAGVVDWRTQFHQQN